MTQTSSNVQHKKKAELNKQNKQRIKQNNNGFEMCHDTVKLWKLCHSWSAQARTCLRPWIKPLKSELQKSVLTTSSTKCLCAMYAFVIYRSIFFGHRAHAASISFCTSKGACVCSHSQFKEIMSLNKPPPKKLHHHVGLRQAHLHKCW